MNTPIENGFAADWLALREPFDAKARNRDLATRFATALNQKAEKKLIDLGAGTGANFRYLAPLIGGDQHWRLIDHDPRLLALQVDTIAHWAAQAGWRHERHRDGIAIFSDDGCWRVQGEALDLARELEKIDLRDIDGVTTTAFLDLVSAQWLDRLAAWLAANRCALLVTLSVDGRRVWQPALDGDALIDQAFRDHQAGDKGFGDALGNEAAFVLADHLRARGYDTTVARSDWQIDAAHPMMLNRMATEAAQVAQITDPSNADTFAEWLDDRLAQIAAGQVLFSVGHLDLLGLVARQ